ncbi:cav-2 [Pristionchus pacificus]|uniref:Caveolin n=1 Tax=Pristionchus pacificus TaxID=54126 RepID=A0A2A6C115_PRIPA|nr:cav-2 [Pristionchus pacificus]|eukprot:PDM71797.1 cav-2 [Pristionchus pacificus]
MSNRSSRSSTQGGVPPSAPAYPPVAPPVSQYYEEPPIVVVEKGEKEKMKIAEATLEDEIQAYRQDMLNRDPMKINRDLKVGFNEIFAEPDVTLHSIDCVWTNSYKVFELTKLWWYRFLSVICGLPIAICMGCCFACFSFNIIWCFQPCVRAFRINMLFIKQLWAYTVHIFIRPLTLACGGIFSTIRIHQSNGEYKEESFIV